MPILAGAEIGVASTKAFTCQLFVLLLLALRAAGDRGRLADNNRAEMIARMRSRAGGRRGQRPAPDSAPPTTRSRESSAAEKTVDPVQQLWNEVRQGKKPLVVNANNITVVN